MLCAAPSTPRRREVACRRKPCGAAIGRTEGSPGRLLSLAWRGFPASGLSGRPVVPTLQASPPHVEYLRWIADRGRITCAPSAPELTDDDSFHSPSSELESCARS